MSASTRTSLGNQALRHAVDRGYRVTRSGQVIGVRFGRPLKLSLASSGYLVFSTYVDDIFHSLLVHRFVAYCKYGEALFDTECARHLDGNNQNNSWDNIAVGTVRENMADRSPEMVARAQAANRRNRKLTDDQVRSVRFWHDKIHPDTGVELTRRVLGNIYGVDRAVVHNILVNNTYKDVS